MTSPKPHLLLGALLVARIASAQNAQPGGALTINGAEGRAPIVQVNDKSYVDLQALARMLNGSLSLHGGNVELSFSPPHAPPFSPTANQDHGFSKEFVRAGIEEMSVIREWRSALMTAVSDGYHVTEEWVGRFRSQATSNLALASTAASTDSDHRAYQLLSNVLNKMSALSDQVVAARKSMTYLAPDAFKNDPLNQQILDCAHALQRMATSGAFQDDPVCH